MKLDGNPSSGRRADACRWAGGRRWRQKDAPEI